MSFSKKVVIVTGASSGMGAAAAKLFSKEDANVVVVGRNTIKLAKTVAECEKYGNKILTVKAELSNEDDVKKIIKETIDAFGRIDVLVNSAGVIKTGSMKDGKILDIYDEVMNVNLRAIVYLTTLATPYLIAVKGNVINISSTGSEIVPSILPLIPYCISKAGLEHFTRGAALELATSGVRVNAIRPGPVVTDALDNSGIPVTWDTLKAKTALDRLSGTDEIAELVLYLASDRARGVTGSVYTCDNGYMLKN